MPPWRPLITITIIWLPMASKVLMASVLARKTPEHFATLRANCSKIYQPFLSPHFQLFHSQSLTFAPPQAPTPVYPSGSQRSHTGEIYIIGTSYPARPKPPSVLFRFRASGSRPSISATNPYSFRGLLFYLSCFSCLRHGVWVSSRPSNIKNLVVI